MKPGRRAASIVVVLGLLVVVAIGWIVFPSPVTALTAEEVLDKMSEDERGGYLAGNIDMAAQLSYFQGQKERSDCIFNWYYKDGGVKQVVQALDRFRGRQAQPVIYALIKRACGE